MLHRVQFIINDAQIEFSAFFLHINLHRYQSSLNETVVLLELRQSYFLTCYILRLGTWGLLAHLKDN